MTHVTHRTTLASCRTVAYEEPLPTDPPARHQLLIYSLDEGDAFCTRNDAVTGAGIAVSGTQCIDLGMGDFRSVWRPLSFVPPRDGRPSPMARAHGDELQSLLSRVQFPARCTPASTLPVPSLPLIGFGQALEYLNLALSQAGGSAKVLVLGRHASFEWTSSWFCGD